jgi:two-component system OmpR family sensor kinase
MQIQSNDITHELIQAHMHNMKLNIETLFTEKGYMYGLYDNNKKPIFTQLSDSIDFSKKTYRNKNAVFYINDGALGHLGVSYVVIKELTLKKQASQLLNSIIIFSILMYFIITMIGFILAKLFIYPIQNQRKKLNNFIKDTTHELNTPLTALLLSVESPNYSTEQNRNHIRISAKKISNLYKDLTYLFLEHKDKSKASSVDISRILKNELSYFMELSHKKKITITHDIEPTLYKIQPDDFIRIINNILSNAIKYTQRGGHVIITLKEGKLTIQDTGIGIEKDKIDKIFKRYYRATEEVGGFGIGLNIVRSICKDYHINIKVKSVIKEGSTFILNFN